MVLKDYKIGLNANPNLYGKDRSEFLIRVIDHIYGRLCSFEDFQHLYGGMIEFRYKILRVFSQRRKEKRQERLEKERREHPVKEIQLSLFED